MFVVPEKKGVRPSRGEIRVVRFARRRSLTCRPHESIRSLKTTGRRREREPLALRINTYVINLDRSPERWQALSADAARCGLTLIRVPAVDGKSVPEAERTLLDVEGFRRDHGKVPMAGEYGCYASHVLAIQRFIDDDADLALILEDDTVPRPDILEALHSIAAVDDWDMAKLKNNRMAGFRADRPIAGGRMLGRAPFGPTGSSAAYLLNRTGAARLLAGLSPMRVPYDIAFERGWAMDLRVRHVTPDLVGINPQTKKSLTRENVRYEEMKLPTRQRLTTLAFRTRDAAQRLAYAMRGGRA